MSEVINLVQQHGGLFYLITFFWTALEGETFVIFAALAAQRGMLSIELLFLASWMGSFCGDQVYFFIGRNFGNWILRRSPKIQPRLDKVFGWVENNSTLFILTYRFMYGIRNVSSVALGMSKLPWKRFLWLNCLAAAIWAFSFCMFGYMFGDVIRRLGKNHEQVVEHGIVYELTLTVISLFAFILAVRWLFGRWRDKRHSRLMSEKQSVSVSTGLSNAEEKSSQ
ncbi:MAG: DedA family protein [Alphaproteobacteria bacterium]|nr:DedA family protein [Alphaproteobacteria bacterium]